MNSAIYLKKIGLTTPFILFQSNRVDPALVFWLAVRMETSKLRGTKPCIISGVFYLKVVETSVLFTDFHEALCSEYPWSHADAVELRYFDSTEQRFVPLSCDEHLGLLFTLNADTISVKSISVCFRHANNVSRRVFRHHLSLLIVSVLALLVG